MRPERWKRAKTLQTKGGNLFQRFVNQNGGATEGDEKVAMEGE